MTIVPAEKVANNPETLLYHFPSMHPVRYTKMIHEYIYWKHVQTAEKVAKMSGKLLVPRDCIHWDRKKHFSNQRVVIQKKVFFVLGESEMTKGELKQYMTIAIDQEVS